MGQFAIKSASLHAAERVIAIERYMRPLLKRIEGGEIDPSFVITHRMPLHDAPQGYEIFHNNEDEWLKVVLSREVN